MIGASPKHTETTRTTTRGWLPWVASAAIVVGAALVLIASLAAFVWYRRRQHSEHVYSELAVEGEQTSL